MTTLLRAAAGGVRLAVRLTPRASGDRIDGVVGGEILKVSVTAPAVENRANDALLRLLARELRLRPGDLSIVLGAHSRTKTIHLAGPPAELLRRLGGWAESLTHLP